MMNLFWRNKRFINATYVIDKQSEWKLELNL